MNRHSVGLIFQLCHRRCLHMVWDGVSNFLLSSGTIISCSKKWILALNRSSSGDCCVTLWQHRVENLVGLVFSPIIILHKHSLDFASEIKNLSSIDKLCDSWYNKDDIFIWIIVTWLTISRSGKYQLEAEKTICICEERILYETNFNASRCNSIFWIVTSSR